MPVVDFDVLCADNYYEFKYRGVEYQIRSITAEGQSIYNQALIEAKSVLIDETSDRKFRDVARLETLYLSLCTYDREGRAVGEDVIKTWPALLVDRLETEAKKVAKSFKVTEEDELKNSSAATTTVSE